MSRVAYTIGYCRADKEQGKGRSIGSVGSLVELVLLVMSGVVGVQTIMALGMGVGTGLEIARAVVACCCCKIRLWKACCPRITMCYAVVA